MTFEQTREQFLIALNSNAYLNMCECSDMQNAISALEKQIPTKPNISGTRATVCPSCNRFIDRHEQKHGNIDIPCCKWCGQTLDWSDTE